MPERPYNNVIAFPRRSSRLVRRLASGLPPGKPAASKVDRFRPPAALKPANWLVLFVPGLQRQWWHRLVHRRHKHVFALRPVPNGRWILFEPWWGRLRTANVSGEQARKYLAWGAQGDALLVKEAAAGNAGEAHGWMSHASLVSRLLGRRYRVRTPHRFYQLLRREAGVRVVDMAALLRTDLGAMALRRLELGRLL